MSAKKQYNTLLESGDLFELYPGLTGEWEKDKKIFVDYYELNMIAIKNIDVDFEDDL